ncbi:hypothetical protein [Alteromonas sp. a30]|uniref:hypothetical protein n=1 Tax=Alteromonas sp. a30 TaxID=2730917 RepID=UPI00227E1A51|nr:hypothetical protein [Alteromonas sp. a30]MCY7293937.1 hypothetical protein [Alteromonas sp. a30]
MFRLSHFILLFSLFSSSVFAHFSIDKTRLYFDRNIRFQTLTLRNTSSAPVAYTIKVNHVYMTEEGKVLPVKDESTVKQSAKKLLRYSPRSGTILPGGSQIVRFTVRKPAGLESGEYRSQLRMEGGLLGDENTLAARIAYNMPVIIRHGQTEATADIAFLGIKEGANSKPAMSILVKREGNRSLFGSFTITNDRGEKIGLTKGISVYEPLTQRSVDIELTGPVTRQVTVKYEELKEFGGTETVIKTFDIQ